MIPTAAILTTIGAGSLAIFKKLLPRKEATRPDYVTLAEFHQGMDALGDRIDAYFLALCEKIENFASSIQARLTQIESVIARLDERTKKALTLNSPHSDQFRAIPTK